MKTVLWLAVTALVACKAPAPSPPPAEDPSIHVWQSLVEAGCASDDPGGPDAIAEELVEVGDPWILCMLDGGSVTACGAPCDDDAGASPSARVRGGLTCIVRDGNGRLRYARCDGGR